jgi:hypothetical protein
LISFIESKKLFINEKNDLFLFRIQSNQSYEQQLNEQYLVLRKQIGDRAIEKRRKSDKEVIMILEKN